MLKRFALTCALAGVSVVLVAQSPPPPPSPPIRSQEKKNVSGVEDSPPNNAGSGSSASTPLVNQPAPTPTATATKDKGAPNANKSPFSWSNLLTLIFTGVLTGVGILQWLSMRKQSGYMQRQADYMRRGLPVSINAAKSAKFNAIAAQDAVKLARHNTAITERALVLIDSVCAEPPPRPDEGYFNTESIVVVTLKNFGDTAAHSVTVKGKIHFPGGTEGFHEWSPSTVPPQGIRKAITWSLGQRLTADRLRPINFGKGTEMSFTIEVTYTDVFDTAKVHTYKAEGQFIPTLRGFVITSSTTD
jgi:hypothetical protein